MKKYLLIIGALIFGILVTAFFQMPDDKFHVYFLDVGQGDSVFIKTPNGQQIIVDGGADSVVIERLGDVMPFWDKSIDLVVLTHPHADHVGGLVDVLKRYKVDGVLFTGAVYEDSFYDEFLKEIDEQNIPVDIADEKADFHFDDVFFDVIYPFEQIAGDSFENINNSSIAMRVIYKDKEILLTGDSEKEVEAELVLSGADLSADILKAGHHGSKTANSLEFLGKVKPDFFAISCGIGNKFGHPHKETLENLKQAGINKIYRTDIDGTIDFSF